jgi:hypothetical protein
MKKIILQTTAVMLILAGMIIACGKSDNDDIFLTGIYYVIGYDACSNVTINEETGEAEGYYIVSPDLKDTLLTYNLPKDVFSFPATCFSQSWYTPHWFPDSFKNSFKMQISYRIASKEEAEFVVCPAIFLIQDVNAKQIIIKSANKIE